MGPVSGSGSGSGSCRSSVCSPALRSVAPRHLHRATPGRRETTRSLAAESLFLPRVGVVVVAVALPEAADVVVQELEPPDPLRALPEVALRNNEAERVAVLRIERLALVAVRQQDVRVVEDR